MYTTMNLGEEFSCSVVSRHNIADWLPDWRNLSENLAEDAVYYVPSFALPLLTHVARNENVTFLLVWRGGDLVAFLPFVRPLLPGLGLRARAWETLYTYSSTPLLSRHDTAAVAKALISAARRVGGAHWVIPNIRVGGAVHAALSGALAESGAVFREAMSFNRASLEAGRDFDEHMREHVGSKRRREMARNRRKLEELGSVTHETHTDGPGLERAVEAFLDLEQSGWKGRKGTALACRPETREFALRAFSTAAGARVRVDLLLLDGKPVAAGVILFSGRTGFTVKGAYDETYSRQGVGMLLELEVLRSFLTEKWADRLDSATAGAHAIDALWDGRMEMADLVFSFSPIAPRLRLDAYEYAENARLRIRTKVKELLHID